MESQDKPIVWKAMDCYGNVYDLGDYGDIVAAAEGAEEYIDNDVIKIWLEEYQHATFLRI